MKPSLPAWLLMPGLALLLVAAGDPGPVSTDDSGAFGVKGKCLACHKQRTPALFAEWLESAHAAHNVTCYDCHSARRDENDAFEHQGVWISTLVTPGDCAGCHDVETQGFALSAHSQAADETAPDMTTDCAACHGGTVRLDPLAFNGLDDASWRGGAVGRVNPDGSRGNCTACHSGHSFFTEGARLERNCVQCHRDVQDPDDSFREHAGYGAAYNAGTRWVPESTHWRNGTPVEGAPTCVSCHLERGGGHGTSHNSAFRLGRHSEDGLSVPRSGPGGRAEMRQVCAGCHGASTVDSHFRNLDRALDVYNEQLAGPAGGIMDILRARTDAHSNPAVREVEKTWWVLLHQAEIRACAGESRIGEDPAQWQRIRTTARWFHERFAPAVRATGDTKAIAGLDRLTASPFHRQWAGAAAQGDPGTQSPTRPARGGADQPEVTRR